MLFPSQVLLKQKGFLAACQVTEIFLVSIFLCIVCLLNLNSLKSETEFSSLYKLPTAAHKEAIYSIGFCFNIIRLYCQVYNKLEL